MTTTKNIDEKASGLVTKNSNILLIDLNNEAPFPTLAIGYLITPLKAAGYHVDVFSPLAYASKLLPRDVQETWKNYAAQRIRHAASPMIEWANGLIYDTVAKYRFRATKQFKQAVDKTIIKDKVDAILISAYLQYREMTEVICARAKQQGIPVLLGGPFFNVKNVSEQWLNIDGVTAIFGGEPEFVLTDLVDDLLNERDLSLHHGIFTRANFSYAQAAPPLAMTNELPIPDLDFFKWDNHPHRIVPLMTGRGCGWGKCLFCSDVTTSSTRGYRSRPTEAVLQEIQTQANRYNCKNFVFFDSKLNSDLEMWYTLIDKMQDVVSGATWVATVHVDGKGENGLDRDTLQRAFDSGLRRIGFGLETGSQKLNNRMLKGTKVERMGQFIKDASDIGISIRSSMMLGYPGETHEDIEQTIAFITEHFEYLDRLHLSKFKAIPSTAFETRYNKKPSKYPSISNMTWDNTFARADYKFTPPRKNQYRKAKRELIRLIHEINKKPLLDSAQQFNGIM
ncbi:B12-binding domain-containing radical SAM protein [Bacterioplanoides sp.]|uniref:B12-binding domain-containing radical SAM protein n=1 Tax=Bacterioplanoides sp. TaxID=2066072 RepID=UPI003AFFC18F